MSNSHDIQSRQEYLVKLFGSANIKKVTGMVLSYNEEGQAIFNMPYNPNFNHGIGGIHGGLIATMIDNAGWFTVAPQYENWVATVEFVTRLHEPVEKEDLRSIGRIVRMGKRLASATMEVRTAKDRLIATGSGTFSITSVPLYS